MEKASNPKEVLSIANALLARNNSFNNFFVDKITSIRDNIISTHFSGIQHTPVEPVSELTFSEMDSFHGISKRSVKRE